MIKPLVLLVFVIFFNSCSVKKDQKIDIRVLDSDGDKMTDKEELNLGRNPLISDIPEMRVRFLQNYSISILYLKKGVEKELLIETKLGRAQPDFKYRVGDIFARHIAFREAARIGEYNTHHFGVFRDQDLTWVKYPNIDERFYLNEMGNFREVLKESDGKIKSISVTLESSVKLKGNGIYGSVKNLEVNFRYYDHEKESYVHLGTKKIERHFPSGVRETFEVVLENVPPYLILDSYFGRGEFIISEIKDYEIPQLQTSYRQLLLSIREKTAPIVYNTPLESKIYYVSLGEGGKKRFHEILKTIFDKQFSIEENKLTRIEQFSNNLGDYRYLQEVKDKDKEGQWFVFTNPLNQHYLDYRFTHQDKISLSYITGHVLARQTDETINAHYEEFVGSENENVGALGNISTNSELHLLLRPKRRFGEKLKEWKDTAFWSGKGITFDYICYLKFHSFETFDERLLFQSSLEAEFSQIELLIQHEAFSLKKLIDEKKANAYWKDGDIHVVIKEIGKIKEISNANENLIALKINPFVETTFNGVLLEEVEGRDFRYCPGVATIIAFEEKRPLSVDSKDFEQWSFMVDWEKIVRGEPKTYFQYFSLDISSLIINLFN